MTEWKDIESAPKDAFIVLKGDRLGLYPYVGRFDEVAGRWAFNMKDPHTGAALTVDPQPTHWQPLPEPPA